jgi:serine/threonine protein kinase
LTDNSPSSTQTPVGQTDRNGTKNGKANNIFGSDIALENLLLPLKRKYLFKKRLGIGNFAKVYLVQQIHLNRDFALKILDFNYILGVLERNKCEDIPGEFSRLKERFINEARIIKGIRHPNIVEIDDLDILDIIQEENKKIQVPYFTMDYIKGTTLREKIDRDGPFSIESAVSISGDILSALKAIHDSRIIHRDIKPENIILEESSNKAILVDFGIAKDYRSNSLLTQMGSLLGTPLYMSPEQIRCQGDLTHKTDIYSFGVVLFEMLTGKVPVEGTDIKKELPGVIGEIIETAIAKDPQDRYQDAGKFLEALKKLSRKSEPEGSDLEDVKKEIQKEYEIVDSLNKGGFAKIYSVRHKKLEELRVLKVMRYTYLLNEKGDKPVEECKERFEREGKLLAKIKHENIVKIYDIGKAGKHEIPYLIMEYIQGKNLDEVLKEKAPLDFQKALNTAENILSALDIMHTKLEKPIIHRDIKPSNIMIEEKTGKAILIDLGIAKDKLAKKDLTHIGTSIGTPAYMSPEQCKGIIDLTPAADIYPLGVVLFEMLTGEVPFKSSSNDPIEVMYSHSYCETPNVRDRNPGLPPGIEQIIFKAMEKDPKDRYQSTKEFSNALRELRERYKDYDYSKNQDARESKEKDEIKDTLQKKGEGTKDYMLLKEEHRIPGERKYKSTEPIGKNEEAIVEKKTVQKQELKPVITGDEKKNRHKEEPGPKKPVSPIEPKKEPAIKKKEEKRTRNLRRTIAISALVIVAFIVAFFIYIRFIGPENRYRELMNSANRYIEENEYKQAQDYLEQALKIKETQEAQWLLDSVENKQREKEKLNREALQIARMKEDFNELQAALKGSTSLETKIEQCRAFLKTYKQIPSNAETDGMRSQIQQSLADLEAGIQAEIDKENQYQSYIKSVNVYLEAGDYSKASEFLQKAKKVIDTPEVNQLSGQIETKKRETERINGTQSYNAIKGVINSEKYLDFKARYPGSNYLPDLKKRLKAADQVLPPEEYWERPIKKNQKGYYEVLFGPGQNGHLMIYIPGRNFWIDKYEVSNLQYRNYLKAVNGKPSTPIGNDENPAVVGYEEAESYCRKYGFRLPTESEWEYAASAGKDIAYPWGNESPDENGIYRANFNSLMPEPVKNFEEYPSPFGVVNMAGNVAEWTQENKEIKLKGGTFVSGLEDLRIKSITFDKSGTGGFRCLKEAKEE